jgi:hypothetical protein
MEMVFSCQKISAPAFLLVRTSRGNGEQSGLINDRSNPRSSMLRNTAVFSGKQLFISGNGEGWNNPF